MAQGGKKSEIDELLEEFRKIGRDSAYCPDSDEVVGKENFPANEGKNNINNFKEEYNFKEEIKSSYMEWFSFIQDLSKKKTTSDTFTQPVKGGTDLCSFCRKNGEAYAFYTSHRLRDDLDRVCCPILYRYVCPICKATGDNAHTIKYCPLNNDRGSIPLITRLKGLRNSMGKRRGRIN
ncbi:uncharacterized protein LOC124155025 [Ischnura elegans]|uniref:uncharacterized protein LOC124155025 n=1 Tax=Ischnura elegans TaxID=197161 RepID=UPI001ED8BD58|nr:uncharacterized protein LOC124155025 [Ischnura elegans]